MTKFNFQILFLAFCGSIIFVGCKNSNPFTQITEVFANPDFRLAYERKFDGSDEQLKAWTAAFENSLQHTVSVNFPYTETGIFSLENFVAYSYLFNLKEGERLDALVQKDSINQRVFLNVFSAENPSDAKTGEIGTQINSLSFPVPQTGTYKLVIQPERQLSGNFSFVINKNPVYGFPVAGKSNNAIGSFWGVERDGGKRKHEGIDIFAKKGTPVVAVSSGRITRTGETGIGGKQVWQRTELFGNSIYYSHLDSIAVTSGKTVKQGDTLGFVGNTGNAKFTPSHLHFGIYKGYSGAIDPLPFVFETEKNSSKKQKLEFKKSVVEVKNAKANMRNSPDSESEILETFEKNQSLLLLGQNADWLHVQTNLGKKGFVHKSLVK